MANHASALKAHRQNVARRNRNRSNRSALRTALKKFSQHIEAAQLEAARAELPRLYRLVDVSVKKKAITPNAAARQKSRLTRRLNDALAAKTRG